MIQVTEQNGVTLKVNFQNGFNEATLSSIDRMVIISKGRVSGLYTISLEKATTRNTCYGIEKEWKHTKTYIKLSKSEALFMFDKKQYELGFFA